MKKQCMIASLLAVAVLGMDLLGASIPFVEMEPDKFPSQSLVNFALVEVHDGFIHPQPERDNWTLFIPLLERVVKYRRSVAKEEVASVEAKILSRFTLYAFACEYDAAPVKAEFGGRLDCLRLIRGFDLIRSDTNTLFQIADWLSGAVPLAVDRETQYRELTEAMRKDRIILYGGKDPYVGKARLRFAGTSDNTRHWEPEFRECKARFRFRQEYNRRLPMFRKAALGCFYHAVEGGYKDCTDAERKAIWDEFCRRAKATAEEKFAADELARNVLRSVRKKVDNCVSALPAGRRGTPEYIREFGLSIKRYPAYQELVEIVSNNQETVCANFGVCATNELARMVLLAAWWGGDDTLFVNGLSHCLDMATAGVVTRSELDWYRAAYFNVRKGNILALRYDEPGVSNLVLRLYRFTGETNTCNRILSGEARISITNYLNEISHNK